MFRLLVVGVIVGALASCTTGPETKPVTTALSPALQPDDAVGDTYVWDTGEGLVTDQIVAIRDGYVSWESSDGGSWTAATDFALPATRWSDPAEHGEGEQKATEIRGAVFPLQVGNDMTMKVEGRSDRYPDGWRNRRDCEVKSQENITVPAGSFDSYKVVCVSGKRTRTFFYSPEVGHIVYYRSYHQDKGGEPRVLVSYDKSNRRGDHHP